MKDLEPDVTVVVLTWNSRNRVDRCLDALRDQELGDLRVEVVVVDNASTDGTAEHVARRHPDVRLVRAASNLGYAGGNNVGLRAAASPWVLVLNDDAVPDRDAVAALARAAHDAGQEVAALTATVLLAARFRKVDGDPPQGSGSASPGQQADRARGPGVVVGPHGRYVEDPAGDVTLVNSTGNVVRTDGYGTDRGWLEDAASHHPEPEVFGFCGAAVLLRRSALDVVGHFDEDFFLYYEDTDLSWRLRRAGFCVRHCADAVVRHEHGASSVEGSPVFRFHDGRNRLLVLTKNAHAGLAIRAVARYLLTTASVALRGRESWDGVLLRLRVLGSYVRLLPRMLRARRRIDRTAVVSRAEVERLLVPATGPGGSYRV